MLRVLEAVLRRSSLFLSLGIIVDVAADTSGVHAFGPEQHGVAGFVAVWLSVMLCVAARSQSLTASLAAQTGPVPVLSQRRHFLGEINRLVAPRADVWSSRERREACS